ncbi:uncharacterized protein LOC143252199 isoform X2 [Tachypleus tridentatus]|uniref:uncharacterized protein LOC143252199 isoform X2 n=1 Tax=Tachypleus tridentatus TaxID=6853 RepID=UPI003FD4DF2D
MYEPPLGRRGEEGIVVVKVKIAELFRKDLISAMKLPDSDQLSPEDYWLISDSWKQEWEKGVQVPVNPNNLAETSVRVLRKKEKKNVFKLPKKYIRCSHDQFFSNDLHVLTNIATQAEKVCRYDLDDLDVQWLKRLNEELDDLGQPLIEEVTVEYIIEDLETQCFENLEEAIKSEEGLGIEYDEDVICDVCRSPDSEEGNEMVFCDFCNICVHQACYGITNIPEGSWVCRTCVLGVRPSCILCPNKGGAMKTTRSGRKWAHVSCALWIPEVSIGNVDKMEPITKISEISPSRWSLLCSLCRERVGACIQCSVKTCKTAYHVTCAFKNNLDMKAIMEDEKDDDGVKLRSYCQKHSQKKETNHHSSDSEVEKESPRKKKNEKNQKSKKEYEMSSEDRANAREKKIAQMSSEFYNYVNTKETAELLQVDPTVVDFVYQYWKLKRKAQFDKPLLTPKEEESDVLGRQQEDNLYTRMKMFVHLRQDLERVRNLCYMVSRREKLFRSWLKLREEIFQTQARTLANRSLKLTSQDIGAVMIANKGSSVYDRMYSMDKEPVPCTMAVLAKLKPDKYTYVEKPVKKKKLRPSTQRLPNPYAKQYINGTYARSKRRLSSVVRKSKGLEKSSEPVYCDSKNQDGIKMESIDRYQQVHSKELSEITDGKTMSTDTSISTNNSLSTSMFSVSIEGSDEKACALEISKKEFDSDLGENESKKEFGGETDVKKYKNKMAVEFVENVINWESNNEPVTEVNKKELIDEEDMQSCEIEIVEETKVKLSEQELTSKTDIEANKSDLANEVEMKVNEQELVSKPEVETSKTKLDTEDGVNISKENFIGETKVEDSDKELVGDVGVKVSKKELCSNDEKKTINNEPCNETEVKVSVNESVVMPVERFSTKELRCESVVNTSVEELDDGSSEHCLKEIESETSLLDASEDTRKSEKGLTNNKSSSESNTLKLNHVEKLNDLLPVIDNSRSNNQNVIDIKNTYSLELLKEVDVALERTDQLLKLSTPKLKVPEKSPLAATNLQKSSLVKTSKKEDGSLLRTRSNLDHSPDKDKLREESAKICESIFATTATSRGSLSGYRIPKKVKSENNILENTRGNSPVSPLSEVSSPKKDTFSTGDSYQKFRSSRNWSNNKDLISHSTLLNGGNQGQSKRLVIKLRKDPNFPDSPRWKRDPSFGEGTDAFKVVQNDWQSLPKRTDRHLRSDRRSLLSNPTWFAKDDCVSKENGANSRYSMRFRTPQNMSKPDTGVS